MLPRPLFFLLLILSVCKAANPDQDVEGSAHMENPDDEDFEGSSGLPPEDETAGLKPKLIKETVPKPHIVPAAPPAVFVTSPPEGPSTAEFSLDTMTIAILVAAIVLVVLVIIIIVVCCRKKSDNAYTRGTPSHKAYV